MATNATTRYRQLSSEVDRIERIPCDRGPTAEEVQHVDDLVAGLRVSAAGGKRYRNLLRRAKDIQNRINDPQKRRPGQGESRPRQAARPSRCASVRTGRQP